MIVLSLDTILRLDLELYIDFTEFGGYFESILIYKK